MGVLRLEFSRSRRPLISLPPSGAREKARAGQCRTEKFGSESKGIQRPLWLAHGSRREVAVFESWVAGLRGQMFSPAFCQRAIIPAFRCRPFMLCVFRILLINLAIIASALTKARNAKGSS